ncbi:hypothetical protein JR316_0010514 [Psilocybe cubensis]|uniref:Uncharacterized protein n=2 Tax=Psilocybe cubensis TaxID=181762 RepID=A0ACB8GMI5_PSICU|nr:hypothetical protein JR316_0010514 [Psilocybe cubensis]KAH9476602.1 hypothetical protein JR316_0010514 [Psilocybe cubensis]
MSEPTDAPTGPSSRGRGRGRGKSRGGLGKYLRARGRGRGGGRPAEFGTRLLLEGEGGGGADLTEEEAAELARETAAKFSRRQLGSNADRYKEEEVELDSDGEPILEPEVDLSSFLERQRISEEPSVILKVAEKKDYDEDDVDTSLAHISSHPARRAVAAPSKKGKVEQIVWDDELDEMTREKNAAEANWELKNRFRAKSEKLRSKPIAPAATSARTRKQELQEAPALPLPEGAKPKTQLEEMEDFLDDLLT